MLEWSPPSDTGGRKDLTYSVVCKKCGSDASQCEVCGGGIRFVPRHTGLINSSVTVLDFVSHVNYTFEIEATNGVSELSFSPKQFTAITVTTDQDGECQHRVPVARALAGRVLWFLQVWVSGFGGFTGCWVFLSAFHEDFLLLLMRALNASGSWPLTLLDRAQTRTFLFKLSASFSHLIPAVSVVHQDSGVCLALLQFQFCKSKTPQVIHYNSTVQRQSESGICVS